MNAFFPRVCNISTSAQGLLAVNSGVNAQLLCTCGMVIFLVVRYVLRCLTEIIESHFRS